MHHFPSKVKSKIKKNEFFHSGFPEGLDIVRVLWYN